MLRTALFSFGMLALVCCCGCQKTLPATIEGTITIDGAPLQGENLAGEVMFYPVGGGPAAYAPLGGGGNYMVQTGGKQGLEPGDYKITVRVAETDPEPPGGYQNAPAQRLLSPPRYQDRDQSELTANVQPGKNIIDLDLTQN